MDFFKRAVESFQSSRSDFEVVCTASDNVNASSPLPLRPAAPVEELVVLDSSYNPPTQAHLRMAVDGVKEAQRRLQQSDGGAPFAGAVRLLLLLAAKNADKAAKPASFEQRLAMMYAFARDVQSSLAEDYGLPATGHKVIVDIGLTTQPYFHDKTRVIAQSGFYGAESSGGHRQPGTGDDMDVGNDDGKLRFVAHLDTSDKSPEEIKLQAESEATAEGREAPASSAKTQVKDSGHGRAAEQIILAGFDTLIRIFNPKYYGSDASDNMYAALTPFFNQARLLVRIRPDAEWGGREQQLAYVKDLTEAGALEKAGGSKSWADRIEVVSADDGVKGVSSTAAREAAEKGDWEAFRRIVPRAVAELVEMDNFYTSN
jgi:nicotinamide-nucleotide adenylyltransferase